MKPQLNKKWPRLSKYNNVAEPTQNHSEVDPDCHNDLLPSDLNKACGNSMDAHEAAQMHQNFSQQLLQDHIAACSLPEHNLITVSTAPISQPTNSEPGFFFERYYEVTCDVLCSSGRTASLLCNSSLRSDPQQAWPACSESKTPTLTGRRRRRRAIAGKNNMKKKELQLMKG